uniref:Rho-GAP domain-containing protein n=1 Tax=Calidris pygmaea TaxID=425635 RepID=A0A8C3KIY6_9CHAR
CSEFVEQHGVVDGIYRLSGVSSNIQRLRQEFEGERGPDLRRDIYLQDIHCVSSLCKAYFRELPNPLLTYQLYDKFADAVAIQMEEARLVKIKEVLKELPPPHYRTLEFLMRHLLRMASHSAQTNMHARNLAIVWAPNLLRSKDIEATGFNGTAAFMEVRVQSIVVEFILTHVEQLFGDAPLHGVDSPRRSLLLGGGGAGAGQPPPFHVPAALSQGDGPPPIRPYHTIIELGDHRRKGSLKAKKWRSIFNLGRSGHEAKRKLGKAEEKDDKGGKISLRPAKSMDSLSSVPFASDGEGRAVGAPGGPSPSLSPTRMGGDRDMWVEGEPRGPESEGESSTKSEPTTPKASRASLVATGRSPKAARSRAEKCAGVHISGPFSVTVPFHITSNLSRLTRGLPCPALGRDAPDSPPEPTPASHGDPQPRSAEGRLEGPPGCQGTPRAQSPPIGEGTADAEQTRLSLELRDSFAFLDSPETWPEGGGDGDMVVLSPSLDTTVGDGEESPAMEEGMESGFMNVSCNPRQPASYLSIEEAMDEEMFFMAPSGSDPEEGDGDTDSDDMFLSANDDLSPLVASLGTLQIPHQPPGEGMATETPALARPSTPLPQDGSPSLEEDAPDLGELPGDPTGLHLAPPEAPLPTPADPPGSPGLPQPVVVLRHDGSAPARLAARTVRVQQARSVPVVPPKPQFAKIPPAPQSWASPSTAEDAIAPPQPPPSPPAPEGPPGASRRAGWREGGSASFDTAVAAAAQQQPAQGPVRRIQTYSGGEAAPAAPKALPFQRSPLRPRLLRPLSCVAAPEAELSGRSRRSLTRPPAQAEGAAGEH